METKSKQKTTYFVLVGMSTAILLVTPVVILAGAGFLLDKLLGTTPWILIIGTVAGFIGGMLNVYKLMTKMKQ